MNWLDGIIGFISPEWGARREARRQSLTEMRNYDAGNYDRGNANWRVLNQSAEFTDRYSRDNVRARARDLERNSDMMNSVIGAYKRNVIGGGYALQAKTGSDKTNEIIQTAWKKWCKKQNCDVTGTQSFTQMMRMCVKRKKVDGGILIIKRYTKDGYLPFKLQTFEVDELDNSQMLPKKKGNKVVGGIEMNEYNKPITKEAVQGMILALQNQTDQFREATIIRPAIIIVPSGYMFDMYTLFYSPTISTSGNTQAVNPLYRYKDSITVVEDPTINALCGGFGNVMPWWLLGAKDDTDFIEVDYLNGQEIPTIRRMETPGTLGFVWDIYLDWGISVMDYRGAIKNPGIEVKNPIELA